MMKEGKIHIVLSPLKRQYMIPQSLHLMEVHTEVEIRIWQNSSWLSDSDVHASLRLHCMMREGIRHIVLSPLKTLP